MATDTRAANAKAAPGGVPVWDLTDLYASPEDPALEQDMKRLSAEAGDFQEAHAGQLGALAEAGGAALADAIARFESIREGLGRVASYASLLYAADTSNAAVARFYGRTEERLNQIETTLLFFALELNELSDEALNRAVAGGAARYRPWLENLRKFRPYQLAPELERAFHEKELTSSSAWTRLFDELVADLKFQVGDETLSSQEALDRLSNPDPAKREAAAQALARTFKANIKIFTLIYNTLTKDKAIEDDWRKLPDPAMARHLSNQVEPEVVAALVTAVRDAYPKLSHRYYRLKARWFGMERLNYWDRNAPLPKVDDRSFTWDQARDLVLEAYGEFSPEMSDIAGRFFERGWIDAEARAGKAPGAFSHPTVPGCHPYVLMNFLGKTRDVMTLAHELGHGVHQILAAPQGLLLSNTPLTLAETASVFGEMLTFQKLLKGVPPGLLRRVLIAQKVEDMLNTVVRQTAFYDFERRMHAKRQEGELNSDEIAEIWLGVQRESLGGAILQNEGYENFWCYIPHFYHSPFYVYAYAFGECLVNALYAVYQDADDRFVERYFDLLKAGGSKHHSALLAPFGLDATDPDFWDRGLALIAHFIDELEELTDQGG